MKRILAILVSAVMLLTMGTVFASASEIFEPVGDVDIAWLTPEQASQIVFDGSLDDWDSFGLNFKKLDYTNMITWHVDDQPGRFDEPDAIGPDFAINTYFAADSDYLYVAFYIEDDAFAYSDNNSGSYNGDAFQISIDWNRHMENALALGVDYQNNKNVFYSFSCAGDGEPLTIRIQEGFKDRDISEATSVDPEKPDMKGSAGATDNGWCAEFALSWQLLYSDFEYKTWESPVDLFDETHPVSLGMQICYLNRDETNGPITWAAGTFDNDVDYPQWEPTTNGIYANLKWEEGRTLNCTGIGDVEIGVDRDPVEGGDENETADNNETEQVEDVKPAESETEATEDTTKAEEKGGCFGSIGVAGAVVMASVLAAGVVVCKKKD